MDKETKVIAGGAVIGGIALVGLWLYNKFVQPSGDIPQAPGTEEPFVIELPEISEENIRAIAQDEAISVNQKIALFTDAVNEQFISLENISAEVQKLEQDKTYLQQDLSMQEANGATYQDAINQAKSAMDDAKQYEAERYASWQKNRNKLIDLKNERAAVPFNPIYIKLAAELDRKIADQEIYTDGKYSRYLDAQQLARQSEQRYNSALNSFNQFTQRYVNPLKEQIIAIQNSINIWEISYQASTNMINVLKQELNTLGVVL